MKMKKKVMIAIISAVVLLVIVLLGAVYVYMAPSNVKREMKDQYKIEEGKYMLVVNDQVLEEQGISLEGRAYVPIKLASDYFNERFYWDNKENLLCYVNGTDLMTVGLDSTSYTLGKNTQTTDYVILTKKDDTIYVAMDFVKDNSVMDYKLYTEPNRVVAVSDYTNKYDMGLIDSSTRLRVGPNKKYDYLLDLDKETAIYLLTDTKPENGYQKVMTMDGIEGYIPDDTFKKENRVIAKTDKVLPEFNHTQMNEKICLAWHQVTNMATNNYLATVIQNAAPLNVVSPTWFSLSDNKGNFSSFASTDYVTRAHEKGLKVWGLVNDFDNGVKLNRVLGRTSTRQQLINNLIAAAIQYNLDGINIDFEYVKESTADEYLEFLRELSLKCYSNQMVLSVDNYLPKSHNSFYDIAEQGKVVDYVIFMGYDEHYAGSEEAGSVSSISFVKDGITDILKSVSKDRVVMALPFYTRRWEETTQSDGTVALKSTVYGMDGAEDMLKQNGAMAKWDDTTGQYYAEFIQGKTTYRIWLEEEKSLEEKMKTVQEAGSTGFAFWKLGFERASIWNTIAKYTK